MSGVIPLGAFVLATTLTLTVDGKPVTKRYVIRYPERPNGKLVIGAHGGTGGDRFDLEGRVIGTDETALDDVVGSFVVERGFVYASVDRDGIGGTREGLALTNEFSRVMKEQVEVHLGRKIDRTYLVGLSMGGGIARFAAEEVPSRYDGILIIAGGGGDVPTRVKRQAEMARLWTDLDPRGHPELPDSDARVRDFATVIGTPVAARAFWPFTAAGASSSTPVRMEDTTGKPRVPTIDVAGTFDDIVYPEVLAYRAKVGDRESIRYRLYRVDGAWHISGDDDAISSFRFIARRRGLGEAIDRAMQGAPSYIPTVHEAFEALDRWVSEGSIPPADQIVKRGAPLRRH